MAGRFLSLSLSRSLLLSLSLSLSSFCLSPSLFISLSLNPSLSMSPSSSCSPSVLLSPQVSPSLSLPFSRSPLSHFYLSHSSSLFLSIYLPPLSLSVYLSVLFSLSSSPHSSRPLSSCQFFFRYRVTIIQTFFLYFPFDDLSLLSDAPYECQFLQDFFLHYLPRKSSNFFFYFRNSFFGNLLFHSRHHLSQVRSIIFPRISRENSRLRRFKSFLHLKGN